MQEKYRGYEIKIETDPDPESPREWSNIGTFIGWHRRYNIGDKNPFPTPESAQAHFEENNSIVLPVYMYDHSGCRYSTKPFSCRWDSGQVGYIYVDAEAVCKEFDVKKIDKELREKVCTMLEGEIETYDQWQSGDVYGFRVMDKTGEQIESCWGFYGSDSCMQEARAIVDAEILANMKLKIKKLKSIIINHVSLEYRQEALNG